jgi:hypothetical protein
MCRYPLVDAAARTTCTCMHRPTLSYVTIRRLVIVVALAVIGLVSHVSAVKLYSDACDSRRAPAACEGMNTKNGRTDLALGPIAMVALAASADRPGLAEPVTAAASAALWTVGWGLWGWPLWLLMRSFGNVERPRRKRERLDLQLVPPPPGRRD